MRTVYILTEGPTEEEFINNSLAHYLKTFGIVNCIPIPIETSPGFSGGDVTFSRYRNNAEKLLISDPNAIVTSLIDYYELRNDFPGYAHAMSMNDKIASVTYIEAEVAKLIQNNRLIPYIQLHEFEGILFSSLEGFTNIPKVHMGKLEYVMNHYPNPELINDRPETTPAARLATIVPRYKKTLHGPFIALGNGIEVVLEKCPRFREWIGKIITAAKESS